MTESMREELLGYLLGALDAPEQRKIEEALARSAELRRDLERLRSKLQPLEDSRETYEVPEGLVESTCALVAGETKVAAPPVFVPSHRSAWTMSDLVVVAGVFIAAAMLFLPAIVNSRHSSQITACQNNLRNLGIQLALYSNASGNGYYPHVATQGTAAFAGSYAITLNDNELLPSPRLLICPASNLADRRQPFTVPTMEELEAANQRALAELRRMAGGSYAYSLGVVVDGMHRAPRRIDSGDFALMGDVPGAWAGRQSPNHGRYGQNILYGDGRVVYLVGCVSDHCEGDDPLVNRAGQVEAGLDIYDAVIAGSETPPFQRRPVD